MFKTIYLTIACITFGSASPCNTTTQNHPKRITLQDITKPDIKNITKPDIKNITKPTNTNTVNFVKWTGKNFILDGYKFTPVGFNAYWLGLTEEYDYPKNVQTEEMFRIAQEIGATVIRSHTLGFSGGSRNALRPFDNNLNPVYGNRGYVGVLQFKWMEQFMEVQVLVIIFYDSILMEVLM